MDLIDDEKDLIEVVDLIYAKKDLIQVVIYTKKIFDAIYWTGFVPRKIW